MPTGRVNTIELLLFARLVTTELPVMFQVVPLASVTVLVLALSVSIAPVSTDKMAPCVTMVGLPPDFVAPSTTPLLPITVAPVTAILAVPLCTANASAAEVTFVPVGASVFVTPACACKRNPTLPEPDVVTLPPLSVMVPRFRRIPPGDGGPIVLVVTPRVVIDEAALIACKPATLEPDVVTDVLLAPAISMTAPVRRRVYGDVVGRHLAVICSDGN